MRTRIDCSRLLSSSVILRTAVLVAVLFALLIATAGSARATGTIVSGTKEDNTPLIIDPASSPSSHLLTSPTPIVFFIQSMPTTKRISSITLGDLGVDEAACGASGTAAVRLVVNEHLTGDFQSRGSIATTTTGQTLNTTLRRITWTIPTITLQAGRGYSFQLVRDSGCASLRQRTWAHVHKDGAALNQVNAGPGPCVQGPTLNATADHGTRRMWHLSGTNDWLSPCVASNGSGAFRPAIGTGWLASIYAGTGWVLMEAAATNEEWAIANACQTQNGISYTDYGAQPVFGYTSDGPKYHWFCRWAQFGPPGTSLERGWYYALPFRSGGGIRDMYLRLGPTVYDNPATFRPHLRFHSNETYRPLDVGEFQKEVFVNPLFPDQTERHSVCNADSCWDLMNDSSLTGGDHIDVHGDNDAINYHTPNTDCMDGNMRDCDTGPASSIYHRETFNTSTGAYYIDYWIFYRYNDWQQDPVFGDHEGDWESVTIGKSSAHADTFDFASFSQHGTWFSYLRGNLRCDLGGAGSCGTAQAPKGRRIDTFVADGSHANYPVPCTLEPCFVRSDAELPDGLHDGEAQWGNDDLRSALKPISNSWAEWAGTWGTSSSPGHASNGVHFDNPGSSTCADGNDGCNTVPLKRQADLTAAARAKRDSRCGSWFGGHVRAVACAPSQLTKAARGGGLGGTGTFGFELPLRASRRSSVTTASAPGIAQTVGGPLKAGSRLTIKGKAADGTVLLVRADSKTHVAEAEFTKLGLRRGGRATIVVGSSKGRPTLRLVQPGGAKVKPVRVKLTRKR